MLIPTIHTKAVLQKKVRKMLSSMKKNYIFANHNQRFAIVTIQTINV